MNVPSLLSCVILVSVLSRSRAQCDNVLLPNVGGLSQCLDTRLGDCGTNAQRLEEDLEQFFDCMFDELPRITEPAAALFNLEGLYQAVLSELQLPVNVSSVATLLCYRLNFSLEACAQPAVSADARCGSLLSVFFPSSFAVRQCVHRSALICFEGDQPKERTIKALFGMLTCVFEGAPENIRPRLARSLACPLVQLLRLALKEFAEVITWPLFAEQVRDSVEQLATLLLHLANCQNDMATITSGSASSIATTLPSSTTGTNSATATMMSWTDSPTPASTSTNAGGFTTNSNEVTTASSSYPATSTTSSTTAFSIRTITSSELTTGSSSPTLSPPSTTASSMTLPLSSQTSSPYSAPTSSIPSSSSRASGQTSTQGPSSAPAENVETGTPASVPTSTTAPTQTGNNASMTLSTIISTSTSPIPSSTSSEITSMQPTEAGSPFTVTRCPRTEVNSDSSNTTTAETLSTTQRTILTSLTIADVNATYNATTRTGTSVTQVSTSRISASVTTVSPYDMTTTTGGSTQPQNSNTPIRATTIFTTSNIPTRSTVSVPSDSSSINGTSLTEGQTISRATTASNSSPGTTSGGTSFWPSLPSPSNTFNPETSSTVSDQNSANNSTPVTTSTVRSTNMMSFMTTSSVTSTENLSTSASMMQGSNETPERTPTVSTAVTSAMPTTGSSASCVNITLPNLFGLDTCLGRTLDACITDNDVYEIAGSVVTCTIRVLSTSLSLQCVLAAVKDIIVAAFRRFSSEGDDSLASVLSPFTCNSMALDGLFCSGNLSLTFPRRFAKCMNGSTEVCRGQEPIQEFLVSSLMNQVKCILLTIVGDAPSSVLSEILCEVSSVLAEKVRQLPYFGFLRRLLKPVLKLLRRIVGCE